MSLLDAYGPGASASPPDERRCRAYAVGLAGAHYENFSVLSGLVPADLVEDFAAVYAFCRWADDLADETGADDQARQRSLELLNWWREQARACDHGEASHPVFVALRPTMRRYALPVGPFEDLIGAFEQDQRVRRYETWEELLGYCRGSADPVGRLVLMMGGFRPPEEDPSNADRYAMSDATCTALQLTNFWQDVRRDLLERDRLYMPRAETGLDAAMLRDWTGRPDDPAARVPFIRALRPLVERTWTLFERGRGLPRLLDRRVGPIVWLFAAGGRSVLRRVERGGCTTLWRRPVLGRASKAALVARAWVSARAGRYHR